MLGDTVKCLGLPKHVRRFSKTLRVPKTCWKIKIKCLRFPKHVGRYSKMIGAPKTCWEIQ